MGSGKNLIKKEAKDMCVRLHSGIRLSIIDEVKEDSMEEEDKNERNKTDNENTNDNKEASMEGSGVSVFSPDNNCEASIDSGIERGLLIDP